MCHSVGIAPQRCLLCSLQVLPARHFESFLVHHRTNNKLGIRGESVPGVPISLLREWVEQFIRDESFLKPEGFDYL